MAADAQAQQYAPPPVAQAPAADLTAQLHESGALTDEEFATAKQELLAG